MTRLGLISDVHGNQEALQAVLRDVDRAGVKTLACLGDIVGYGPDPGECLELVAQRCDVMVIGNHDEAVLLPEIQARFNDRAQVSIRATIERLRPSHLFTIGSLPEVETIDQVTLTHATFTRRRYEYLHSVEHAERALIALPTPIGAIGHTHRPAVFTRSADGRLHEVTPRVGIPVRLPRGGKSIVNPGSVGQPRDGQPEAAWGVLDLESQTFELRRVPYPIEAVMEKIIARGLPKFLGERLRVGA